ncbi:conserved phage C-terminal domain-containing protein [Hafnia paralvei]
MSNKLSGYVWDGCAAAGLKLSEVAIMARLADFSSDEGKSWPSVTTIARQIGAGESTVRTALGKLEREGWISRQQRRAGNRNASNIYQLNVEKLRLAAHASESDPSKSDASKFDGSKSDASKSSKKGGFHPSESGGDPSVTSTPDPSSNKTFCQPLADPEVEITDQAIQVLKHLNRVTSSRYQNCKSSLENIRGRLRDGFTTDELILVVDFSVERWASNLDMAPNLNPTTLFRPGKFPTYLSSATNWSKAGRPPRIQWSKGNQAKPKGYVDMDFSQQDYSSIPAGFRNGYSSEQPREQAAPVDRSDLPKWLLERTGGAL